MYNFYQLTNFYEYSVYDLKSEMFIDIINGLIMKNQSQG
jgi:hypothetical protein